jgi:hypothetical protein
MDLQRTHDRIRPTRYQAKQEASSVKRRKTVSKQSIAEQRIRLDKLLRELADLIETEQGILTL